MATTKMASKTTDTAMVAGAITLGALVFLIALRKGFKGISVKV